MRSDIKNRVDILIADVRIFQHNFATSTPITTGMMEHLVKALQVAMDRQDDVEIGRACDALKTILVEPSPADEFTGRIQVITSPNGELVSELCPWAVSIEPIASGKKSQKWICFECAHDAEFYKQLKAS